MNLYALDIPDDPARLPDWLERHLTGLDLARLVAELIAVHGTAGQSEFDLDRILGAQKQSVLDQGLGVLSRETLCQFLLHPRLLLDLQELVLRDGGSYWSTFTPHAEHMARVQRGADKLQEVIASRSAPAGPGSRSRQRWYQRPWFASLATAASLVAIFVAYDQLRRRAPDTNERPPPRVESSAWGWNKADALPAEDSRSAYLNRLAAEAGDWFQERATDALGIARRIHAFRAGCSRLIFSEHKPLPPADRQWLVENCRTWGRKLDKQLAALESGQNDLEVRAETDVLIQRIIDELRARAKAAA